MDFSGEDGEISSGSAKDSKGKAKNAGKGGKNAGKGGKDTKGKKEKDKKSSEDTIPKSKSIWESFDESRDIVEQFEASVGGSEEPKKGKDKNAGKDKGGKSAAGKGKKSTSSAKDDDSADKLDDYEVFEANIRAIIDRIVHSCSIPEIVSAELNFLGEKTHSEVDIPLFSVEFPAISARPCNATLLLVQFSKALLLALSGMIHNSFSQFGGACLRCLKMQREWITTQYVDAMARMGHDIRSVWNDDDKETKVEEKGKKSKKK
ncbi:hypothetical protein ADUPG1_000589 [Aduncisulcus paluster]|uniref:Uncharacterized protein n=1 Tax=Aduncisulcus paluster TaxID=2918883 RepID=A0ABQ5K6Z8_9EUKA|nr:hypothetical protein ADUPG1_000589 [Aduncisulcus paluster]